MLPQPELMIFLENLRAEVAYIEEEEIPISINSAARCAKYNSEVADTGFNGPHTLGLAVDIPCYGPRAHSILTAALRLGATGIGPEQRGPKCQRFIHLDIIKPGTTHHPRPYVWGY